MFRLFITRKAQKDLDRLSPPDAKRVSQKILRLDFPFPAGLDIQKMTNTLRSYRLRDGKVRVILEVDINNKRIYLNKVAYRGNIY